MARLRSIAVEWKDPEPPPVAEPVKTPAPTNRPAAPEYPRIVGTRDDVPLWECWPESAEQGCKPCRSCGGPITFGKIEKVWGKVERPKQKWIVLDPSLHIHECTTSKRIRTIP